MSTSFSQPLFVWLGSGGLVMFRWCDAVMQGRTAVLPLKSVQPNLLSLEFESIKRLYSRP